MKVAIDVSQIAYEGTGVAVYTKELVKNLLLIGSDHQFVLYAGALKNSKFFKELALKKPFNQAEWIIKPLSPKIANLVFNHSNLPIDPLIGDFDVLHASDWTHPSSSRPTVTTVHDLVFKRYPDTVDSTIIKAQQSRFSKLIKKSYHIIVDSKNTENDLVKIYDVNPARITVIYLGYDQRFCRKTEKEIDVVRNKYHLPKEYLLTLSSQEPRKNIQKTIEAYKALIKNNKIPAQTLVVAGKKGWGPEYHTTSPYIQQIGFVDDEDLPALYSGANAFLYLSLYEGFGLPVLEAMACGVPVLSSNTSSLPEVVGNAGVLVNPSRISDIQEGIIKILTRSEFYAEKSLNQASKFSWEKTATETLKVYENVFKAYQAL